MGERLQNLIWLGSLVGTLLAAFLFWGWDPWQWSPFGLLIVTGIYISSGLLWTGVIPSYRRQELNYYAGNGWLHFFIGIGGPFLMIWDWLIRR